MTREEFTAIKVEDRVAMQRGGVARKVRSIFDDRNRSGAFIVYLATVTGAAKTVTNMVSNDGPESVHYSEAEKR